MNIVIDASYLMEFLDNPLDEKFQWILDCNLLAPNLLKYEYNNVLLNKCKNTALANQFREVIYSLSIEYLEITGCEEKIYNLAAEHRLSFYDASYLFVAVAKELPIATYDSQILRAAKILNVPTMLSTSTI
jgi:predicted nucleic acid-binding protein